MTVKPPFSGRLSYALRNLEIKEGLQNSSAESFLPRSQQMGVGDEDKEEG